MAKYVRNIMISREEIAAMCRRLGEKISADYAGREIILIGVLKGAWMFLADLARNLSVPTRIDFISVSSYGSGTRTSGVVKIVKDLDTDITGRHIIIVEDIVDTGLTLNHLRQLLGTRNPASIAICAAFDKKDRRQVDITVEYAGIEIPDEFIVGYGLDYDGKFRNLPDVSILCDDSQGGER
jgi:hypoxanthine phosphoribosyltransferase